MNEYTGEQTKEAYLAWLAKEYPQSEQAPIFSRWEVGDRGLMIVGYCRLDGEAGVKVVWEPIPSDHETAMRLAENVHLRCLLEGVQVGQEEWA